jgi:nitrite reductase/ring-hydroxylating ferredoxin subunit
MNGSLTAPVNSLRIGDNGTSTVVWAATNVNSLSGADINIGAGVLQAASGVLLNTTGALNVAAGAVFYTSASNSQTFGSLSGGDVQDGHAVCPWHQWPFSLQTGQLRNRPLVKIRTYPTRLLERQDKPTLLQADLPTY